MSEEKQGRLRLLLIDELKILGIAAVVLWHIAGGDISIGYMSITYQDFGLFLFIVASGMGLAYNTPSIPTFTCLKEFYIKRFMRIYPIYWIFVLILLIIAIILHNFTPPTWTLLQWLETFLGFQAYVGDFNGRLSVTFWFIGLIVFLYILYPLILWANNRNRHVTIALLFIISILSTLLVPQWSSDKFAPLWFPLCRVFEFGLGIYLISIIDPVKIAYHNALLILLADLSFYVYLTHYPLIGTMPFFGGLALPIYIVLTFVSAYILFRLDGIIQAIIRRNFLEPMSLEGTASQPAEKPRRKKRD
jgi:peptidoglycan/LPS O-acetylase OafA/YrhL